MDKMYLYTIAQSKPVDTAIWKKDNASNSTLNWDNVVLKQ